MVFSKSGQSTHFCCACFLWSCELKVFFRCGTVKSGMYSASTREAIIMCLKLIITEEYDKKGVLIVLHAAWQLHLLLIWLKSCCQIGRESLASSTRKGIVLCNECVYRWLAIWNAICKCTTAMIPTNLNDNRVVWYCTIMPDYLVSSAIFINVVQN